MFYILLKKKWNVFFYNMDIVVNLYIMIDILMRYIGLYIYLFIYLSFFLNENIIFLMNII